MLDPINFQITAEEQFASDCVIRQGAFHSPEI